MPTFPQHRNMKKAAPPKENREPETNVTDQTNNLPAISDLVSIFIFSVYSFQNVSISILTRVLFFSLDRLSRRDASSEWKP